MARIYHLQRRPSAPAINYEAELNPQQLAAVTAPPGPALVIAGAGSGKTRTLTYRVAYLLEQGLPPSNILLLTFTNKAAREMQERVETLLPNRTQGLWGGTFHSIGNRILRRHPVEAGYAPGFSILDREDSLDLLKPVIAALGIDPKDKRFPKAEVVGDILSLVLNTGATLDAVLEDRYPYFLEFSEQIAEIGQQYEARKKKANALDFDDLLEKPLRLFRAHPEIARFYQQQFQTVLVDEYQDTNRLQADFIDAIGQAHGNVMVVGDDAQSIYSWRGANFRNILDFAKRYPGAVTYKIETNYRSIPEVLEVANAAIAENTEQFTKQLAPARQSSGVRPALVPLESSNDQALFIAQHILALQEQGVDLRQIAILYRAHYHSMEIQMELTRHGIPFSITSGLRFFEQAHTKDAAAFLKFIVNPRDEVAFKRMTQLLPGVGARSAEKLWLAVEAALREPGERRTFADLLIPLKVPAKAKKSWEQLAWTLDEIAPGGEPVAPATMLHSVIEAVYDDYLRSKFPNYEARREDLHTLENFARQYESAAEFLDQLALLTNLETSDSAASQSGNDQERVTLSTIHQAKGLEWRVVFLVWLTEGMFPSSRSIDSKEAIEEERRLFYVAVTRAEDELYLTYPLLRTNAGYGEMIQRPSRFLGEIPKEKLEEWQISNGPF